ncbi:hypothetical protein MBOURGENBZM_09720 [Methanoculleus bourgensis]|jgi:hypothetical protein|nr:hypothetical protein MBOURGENBZM_09720 [Methanoculleus bourgensis]
MTVQMTGHQEMAKKELPYETLEKNHIVIREDPEDGGYVVSCPAIPGCPSQGETS